MIDDIYHPEWETGEWRTNCDASRFEELYIRNEPCHFGGQPFNLDPNTEYMIGSPRAGKFTVEALLKMGTIGIYQRPKQSKQPKTKIIADAIRSGLESGNDWSVDIDHSRIDDRERDATVKAIAGFVEDGITQGISPFWKLTLNKS